MALFSRFFGGAAATGAGFAFGHAAGPVLAPAVEQLRQEAWKVYSVRVPDAFTLASGVAQGQVDRGQAEEWASRHGFGDTAFSALVDIATTGPDIGLAMQAWRRGELTEREFRTVLRRHSIEPRWDSAIEALKAEVLAPATLAQAIHRGLVPDPGLLEGRLPSGVGHVPAYPVYDVDALAEAAASGLDRDRLGVLVGLQGNPMGPHEAAQAFFRAILTEDDYLRAIAEGNTRNEWADAIREQTRQIPTARDFLENALRGYRSLREALDGAARHGMTEDDATMIYQNQGRPMAVRLITQALARGGKFKPEPGEIRDPFDAAIVEGNLKPAYYDLAKALRYTQPTPFAIRQLAQAKTWDQQYAETKLLYLGWEPKDAKDVSTAWAGGSGGGATGPWAKRAETQLWTATHKGFINGEVSEPQADAALTSIGVPQAERRAVLTFWNEEKNITVKPLTPSQIKRAYKANDLTIDDAVARLELQHYTDADARTYLTT